MTIATTDEVDASGFQDPIAVLVRPVDDRGEFAARTPGVVVVLEGSSLFRETSDLAEDMEILKGAIASAASRMGLPEERVAIEDFDFVDAPRTSWLVDAEWDGDEDEDEGRYAANVVASNDRLAQALCATKMARDDEHRPEFTTGPALFDHAIQCAYQHLIHSPLPQLAFAQRVKELMTEVVAAEGLGNAMVDEMAVFAKASDVGRRGEGENDGDFLVVFTSDDPTMDDLSVVIPAAEFKARVGAIGPYIRSEGFANVLEEKAKDVASRYVDYDAYDNDSNYMDDLDCAKEGLKLHGVGKIGLLQAYDTVGFHEDQEGVFQGIVHAVDEEDAILQTAVRMAAVKRPGRDGYEVVGWAIEGNEIGVERLPFDLDEARSRLRSLCASDETLPEKLHAVVDEFRSTCQDYDHVMENRSRPTFEPTLEVSAPRP